MLNDSTLYFTRYDKYVQEMGDERVKDWFLMQSPMILLLILAVYLGFCNSWGPRFMKHRRPYELKTVMLVYNAVNVALSVWILQECLMGGWWRDYSLTCQPVDNSPKGYRMARMTWVALLCKLLELLDTVFIILRKKDNQATYLHLYHHATTPICCWLGVKFVPGGHLTSAYLFNAIVHVVMYSYYLLAALGPAIQKHLWWKKYITTMQLVQFVMMLSHQSLLFVFDCEYQRSIPLLQIVQASYFFYLFSAFYTQSYTTDKPRRGKEIDRASERSMIPIKDLNSNITNILPTLNIKTKFS